MEDETVEILKLKLDEMGKEYGALMCVLGTCLLICSCLIGLILGRRGL